MFIVFYLVDTEHERNALMEHVYPKLRQFCEKRGYEFQVNLSLKVINYYNEDLFISCCVLHNHLLATELWVEI